MTEVVGTPNRSWIYAVMTGSFFAILSIWMIRFTASAVAWLNGGLLTLLGKLLFSFLIPGLAVGYMISGNIHVAQTWIVALANFGFYYVVAYLIQKAWLNLRSKSRREAASSQAR